MPSRPECTPASSTCSMTPQTSTSPVESRRASTSTSTASSKKRSTSTGRSADTPPSRSSDPNDPPSSWTTSLRPVVVVDDLHGSSTEHVARADENRIADLGSHGDRLVSSHRRRSRRLGNPELFAQGAPPLPVFCEVDRFWARAENHLRSEAVGQLERGLAAEAHDDPRHVTGTFRRIGLGGDHVRTSSAVSGSK